MKKKRQSQLYCFIDKDRPCTISCKAAYRSGRDIYCMILWAARNVGYMADVTELKIKQKSKRKLKTK